MSRAQAPFTKSDLQELLTSKSRKKNVLAVGADERKKLWLDSLHKLYSNVKDWLQGMDVSYEERSEAIYEMFAGTYDVPVLIVRFTNLNETIGFFPKSMFVLTADGKVEITGRFSKVNLIQKTWGKWEIVKVGPGKVDRKKLSADTFYPLIKDLISLD